MTDCYKKDNIDFICTYAHVPTDVQFDRYLSKTQRKEFYRITPHFESGSDPFPECKNLRRAFGFGDYSEMSV